MRKKHIFKPENTLKNLRKVDEKIHIGGFYPHQFSTVIKPSSVSRVLIDIEGEPWIY